MKFNYKFLCYISAAVFIIAVFLIPLDVVQATGTPYVDVEHYRWRNNDGTEVTATGAQTEDNQITGKINDDIMRLRLALDNDDATYTAKNQNYTINWGTNADCSTGHTAIPIAGSCGSSPFCMVDSQLVDVGNTTNWAGITDGAGVWAAGKQVENLTNATANFEIDNSPDEFSEVEYSFIITANAQSSTDYYFSLTGGAITAHDVCPSLQTGILQIDSDLSWDTGAADFEIWAGATPTTDAVNTWDNGTLICSTSLNDDNSRTSTCGSINKNQKYRIQAVLANVGGGDASMAAGDFVDHVNVKTFWAGTSPTISAATDCGFADGATFGGSDDDTSPTCNVAFSGNNVQITNTGTEVLLAATTGKEGFMYLITTDSDVSLSDPSSYMNASIDSNTEDSSRVIIGLKRTPGNYIRGLIKIRGLVKFR